MIDKKVKKMIDTFENFDLRERFKVIVNRGEYPNGWGKAHVVIVDSSTGVEIFEYERNYTFMDTFEPFRWWNDSDECWDYYALISPNYIGFSIVNLKTGEKVYSSPTNSFSFCPVSFYVPDFFEFFDGEFNVEEYYSFYEEAMKTSLKRRSFALVKGTVWGDDWCMKVETIDLRKIIDLNEEGVISEPKFGYFVMNGKLMDRVSIDYFFDKEFTSFSIDTPMSFKLDENNEVLKTFAYSQFKNFDLKF